MTEYLKWKSKGNVPHGPELRGDYSWIPDFLKVESMLADIEVKKAKIEEVKGLPRALPDVRKALEESTDRLAALYKASIKSFITNHSRHPDMMSELRFQLPDSLLRIMLMFDADQKKFWFFDDALLDECFKELGEIWPQDAISDSSRKAQRTKLNNEISALEAEIEGYPDYARQLEFVTCWRGLNSKLSEGCDPQGFAIVEKIRPGDFEAFQKLKMAEYLNPKSEVLPARST